MKIEFISEIDDENGTPVSKVLDIDIEENLSIEKLFSKIHEITGIPKFKEMKWGDEIEKISCTYYFKSSFDSEGLEMIDDLSKQISDFPKKGSNKELCLYIEESRGFVN